MRDVHRRYGEFRACYEASSGGYVLHKDLKELGVDCALLTECLIPDRKFESARGLVRSRTGLIQNLHRSKMRVIHLLRAGRFIIREVTGRKSSWFGSTKWS
ncbi:MAG: hypothetical protein OXE92_03160 [Bacteroidetes bacterium]|nr:hypothetical protein [Bacteroidota bacterium]MCY4204708.1 hypothetical protein [Bacteroidota bacterium]